ncbi:MAG: OmpA family protein, partial [Magnetococcales bacterium]|nr:OmpA family protein [Magnetococcales bacterium]
PFRLAVEARQKMGAMDQKPALSWRIKLRLNDQPFTDLAMTSAVEDRTPLFVNGQEQVASRLERAFVEIPPGDHELAVASDATLWLRLLRQEEPDYLLPSFNEPLPSPLEVRGQTGDELVQQWQTALQLAQDNSHRNSGLVGISLLRQQVGNRPDYPEMQSKANELAGRHLHYRDLPPVVAPGAQRLGYFLPQRLLAADENGVMAVLPTMLKGAFLERLGQGLFTTLPQTDSGSSSPVEWRAELWFDSDQHTPNNLETLQPWLATIAALDGLNITVQGHADASGHRYKNELLAQERARFARNLLIQRGVAEERVRVQSVGDRQPRADNKDPEGRRHNRRVEMVATGRPRLGNGVQHYRLPERPAPSKVRVLLDYEGAMGATLMAQIDQAPPVSLQLDPARPAGEMAPSPTEAALYLQALQNKTSQPTLRGGLPPGMIPAPLQRAGVAILPVPPGSKELRLWQKQPATTPLWVAVQFEDGKTFALAPTDYAELIQRVARQGMALQTMAHGLLATLDTPDGHGEREMVRTLWHPLLRRVRAEQNQFAASVTLPDRGEPQQADPLRHRQLLEQATRLEAGGDWLNALELRHSAFAKASTMAERLAGWLTGTENLFRLGEPFLAEQRLKALLLLPEAAQLRQKVRDRLVRFYQQQQDDESLVNLYATLFALHGKAEDLRELIPLLVASGDYEQALMAGLLLPAKQRPVEAMIRAALATGWIGLAEEMMAMGTTSFPWLSALSLRRQLDQGGIFEEEPSTLDDSLRRSWRNGLALAQTGPSSNPEAAVAWQQDLNWVQKWATWQAERPGERSWRERPDWIVDYASAGLQYSVEQDRHAPGFRSEPARPVRIQLVGPVKVRLEVRPQHQTTTPPVPLD